MSAIADTIFRRKIAYLFFSPRIPFGLRLNTAHPFNRNPNGMRGEKKR
jgi:hypothetical protein